MEKRVRVLMTPSCAKRTKPDARKHEEIVPLVGHHRFGAALGIHGHILERRARR